MTPLEIAFASASLFMGIFVIFFSRYLLKRDKREERQADILCLILRGVRKTGQLAYANAVAYINHELNGEMKKAVDDYEDCMAAIEKHLEQQAFKK